MNEIIIDSENAILIYSKANNSLELTWKKSINSSDFRLVYSTGIDFAGKNKVLYFLSDIRNEGLVTLEDIKWLTKEVIGKASEIGIKRIALVNEDELTFSSIYAESIKKKLINISIQVQIFNDLYTARSWLLRKI